MDEVYSRRRSSVSRSAPLLIGIGCWLLVLLSASVPSAGAQQSTTVLQGYVFNSAGERVPDALITLIRLPSGEPTNVSTRSDANGEWTLDTGAGIFSVRVAKEGYLLSEQTVFGVSYQTGITSILRPVGEVPQEPLVATVSGRVFDLDDVPLGGQAIVATNAQDTGVTQVAPPPILNFTYSNEDGSYSLEVPAGTIWMTIETGAAWGYQLNPVNIASGQTYPNADFRVAVRVLPRTEFPTATPVPAGPPPGMPTTGSSLGPLLGIVLIGLIGLACMIGGVLLYRAQAR